MSILRVNKIAASGQTSENTGSVFFDGTGDYLSIPNNTQFEVGADFTFETWIYRTSLGSLNTIYSYLTPSTTLWGLSFILTTTGIGIYGYNDGDSNYDELLTISGVVSTNEWHHVAVVRSNSTWYYYIDGVLQGSGTMTSFSYTGTPTFYIGHQNDNFANSFTGYLSNYRVVKGKALYTSNFTPPTTELEVTPETVLVACYDGENIFAEKTGKIIAAYGDRSSGIHTVGESPIGITTFQPGLTRSVDVTAGPVLQGNLEYNSQNFLVLPKGTTEDRNRTGGRGLFGGSNDGSPFSNAINYITISTSGNSQDFGDLTEARSRASSYGSTTRGVWAGGNPVTKTIDYVTTATTGNAVAFGELTVARRFLAGTSSSTRGISAGGNVAGGSPHASNSRIDFTTIATLGDAQTFGELLAAKSGLAALSSPTRALFAGGYTSGIPAAATVNITQVEISTLGNSTNFGDLTASGRRYLSGCSSNTRGVFGSGSAPGVLNTIDYVTIATAGDAVDFGDATISNEHRAAMSNSIRGVWAGSGTPAIGNTIDYITIASTGNAQDFGDCASNTGYSAGCSDSHGGLS